MYLRMQVVSERLDTLGLTHHSALSTMQERLAPEHVDALRVLANAVEPAKGYARAASHRYDVDAPLNHLPDSVPPESLESRKFSQLIDRIVSASPSADDVAQARDLMTAWKTNHDRLSPALQKDLLAEDASVSQNLATAGTIGLQALDMFTSHSTPQPGWTDQQIAQLEQMRKPQSELLLMIVPGVEKLVQSLGR
jgi:hypothetical protein